MAVGFRNAAGVDLDSLFKARVSAPAPDTGFRDSNGVDLSQRYEPRGAAPAIPNTGLVAAGVDLSQIFMDINAQQGLFGTLTTATFTSGFWGVLARGFRSSGDGSISPSHFLSNGVQSVFELSTRTGASGTVLRITGFSTDPGQSFLNYVSVGGNQVSGAAAAYSFSGLTGTWLWNNVALFLDGVFPLAISTNG